MGVEVVVQLSQEQQWKEEIGRDAQMIYFEVHVLCITTTRGCRKVRAHILANSSLVLLELNDGLLQLFDLEVVSSVFR